jgi:hypothetical protein
MARIDGSSRGVLITEESARRISRAIQKLEQGNRAVDGRKLRVGYDEGGGGEVQICKTTAEWAKGTTAELDIIYADDCENEGSGGEKVEAHNISYDVPEDTKVVIALATNGCWYYVTHERACTAQFPAKELDKAADLDASVSDISQGDGPPEALLNDEGCARWWKLHREQVVTDVTWSDGIVVKKKYVWVFKDPEEETEETIIESIVCPEEQEGSS